MKLKHVFFLLLSLNITYVKAGSQKSKLSLPALSEEYSSFLFAVNFEYPESKKLLFNQIPSSPRKNSIKNFEKSIQKQWLPKEYDKSVYGVKDYTKRDTDVIKEVGDYVVLEHKVFGHQLRAIDDGTSLALHVQSSKKMVIQDPEEFAVAKLGQFLNIPISSWKKKDIKVKSGKGFYWGVLTGAPKGAKWMAGISFCFNEKFIYFSFTSPGIGGYHTTSTPGPFDRF